MESNSKMEIDQSQLDILDPFVINNALANPFPITSTLIISSAEGTIRNTQYALFLPKLNSYSLNVEGGTLTFTLHMILFITAFVMLRNVPFPANFGLNLTSDTTTYMNILLFRHIGFLEHAVHV